MKNEKSVIEQILDLEADIMEMTVDGKLQKDDAKQIRDKLHAMINKISDAKQRTREILGML